MTVERLPVVGVMGSSRHDWPELAVPLGELLARRGVHLLNGAGGGVMSAVARSYCSIPARRGLCIGIVPTRPVAGGRFAARDGYPNRWTEVAIVTPLGVIDPERPDAVNRNWINILSSDVVIALPGKSGTRQEIALAITLGKPLLLFGPAEEFADIGGAGRHSATVTELSRHLDDLLPSAPAA